MGTPATGDCSVKGQRIGVEAYNPPNSDRTNADLTKGLIAIKGQGIEDAIAAAEEGADYVGLIFAKSSRKIDIKIAQDILWALPYGVEAVFVDLYGNSFSLLQPRPMEIPLEASGEQREGNESATGKDSVAPTDWAAKRAEMLDVQHAGNTAMETVIDAGGNVKGLENGAVGLSRWDHAIPTMFRRPTR